MQEYGYGLNTDTVQWTDKLYDEVRELVKTTSDVEDEFQGFFACVHAEHPKRKEEKVFREFVDEYESDICPERGLGAVLTAVINEKYFDNEKIFFFDDQCIYVPAYIPYDKEEKKRMPTQKRIRKVLSETMTRLTDEPIVTDWLEIEK